MLKPTAPGLGSGFGFGNAYPKPLKSEGNHAGTLDLSSHSNKSFQNPYGLPIPSSSMGGIETYSALRNSLQSGIGHMPPPSAQRPLQVGIEQNFHCSFLHVLFDKSNLFHGKMIGAQT